MRYLVAVALMATSLPAFGSYEVNEGANKPRAILDLYTPVSPFMRDRENRLAKLKNLVLERFQADCDARGGKLLVPIYQKLNNGTLVSVGYCY